MRIQTIARVKDISTAQVLLVALRAHGFHPMELTDGGLPGVPKFFGADGVGIDVPEDEAGDAKILALDLLKDMEQG